MRQHTLHIDQWQTPPPGDQASKEENDMSFEVAAEDGISNRWRKLQVRCPCATRNGVRLVVLDQSTSSVPVHQAS